MYTVQARLCTDDTLEDSWRGRGDQGFYPAEDLPYAGVHVRSCVTKLRKQYGRSREKERD